MILVLANINLVDKEDGKMCCHSSSQASQRNHCGCQSHASCLGPMFWSKEKQIAMVKNSITCLQSQVTDLEAKLSELEGKK